MKRTTSRMKPVSSYNGVVFRDCKLLGADFARVAENPDVNFVRCNLRYVAFTDVNLRALAFEECELQEAQFASCSLIDTMGPLAPFTSQRPRQPCAPVVSRIGFSRDTCAMFERANVAPNP